jgi:hypothetical protein
MLHVDYRKRAGSSYESSGFSRLNLERLPVWIGIISYLGSCEISGHFVLLWNYYKEVINE